MTVSWFYFHLARPARVNQEGGLPGIVSFTKQIPVLVWPAILSMCVFGRYFGMQLRAIWSVNKEIFSFFTLCLPQASLELLPGICQQSLTFGRG